MPGAAATPLARTLALAYGLLIAYASVHPLAEWRDSGAPLTAFLAAAWPRYYSAFDIWLNIAGYLPLGFLATAALSPRLGPRGAALLATLLGIGLSFGLETAQHFLPSRVPSNLDLASNALGALLGAALALRYGRIFLAGGGLDRWRARRIVRGSGGELGLTLIGLWLLTQVNPESMLLGTGDLRGLLGLPAAVDFSAERHWALELAVAATGVIAAGLIMREVQREFSAWLLAAWLLAALAVKALAWAVLVGPEAYAQWITPGNRIGVLLGTALLVPALAMPPGLRARVAALALLAATALVNVAPENPYSAQVLARWHQGHFFNFNGLTRLASTAWPFLALAYLVARAGRPR